MSAFYQPLETPNKQTSLLWCKATAVWSPLAAGATAYWIQDCCACLPVSSWTSSGVSVFRATEWWRTYHHQGTTIIVVALPSRSDIVTVNCNGDRAFPVAAAQVCMEILSLEVSSQPALCQAFKRRLKTELFLRSLPEVASTVSD